MSIAVDVSHTVRFKHHPGCLKETLTLFSRCCLYCHDMNTRSALTSRYRYRPLLPAGDETRPEYAKAIPPPGLEGDSGDVALPMPRMLCPRCWPWCMDDGRCGLLSGVDGAALPRRRRF